MTNIQKTMKQLCDEYDIGYVPSLVSVIDTVDKHGLPKKEKKMKPFKKYGIELNMPTYIDWFRNKQTCRTYFTNEPYILQQYNQRKQEAEDEGQLFPEIKWLHDTHVYAVVDNDDMSIFDHPEIQFLGKNTCGYSSLVKKLEKYIIGFKRRPDFVRDRIVLKRLENGKVACELLIGQFSYFELDQPVVNSHLPIYIYNDLSDFLSKFDTHEPHEKQDCNVPRTPLSLDETDQTYHRIKYYLEYLASIAPKHGLDYDKWVQICFILVNIFGDNKMGLDLFDYYSKTTDPDFHTYDSDDVEDKWNTIVASNVKNYAGTPATERTLVNIIQSYEDLPTPRLLQCSPIPVYNSSSSSGSTSSEDILSLIHEDPRSSLDIVHQPTDEFQTNLNDIKLIVRHLPVDIWFDNQFRNDFLAIMKGIDSRPSNYELYKMIRSQYEHKTYNDEESYILLKAWEKCAPKKKHNVSMLKDYLKKYNTGAFNELFKSVEKRRVRPGETYHLVKAEFEKTTCKVLSPPCYIHINKANSFEILTVKNCTEKFQHLECLKYDEFKDKIGYRSFIGLWLNDGEIRHYDMYECNPETRDLIFQREQAQVFNTWRGFNAEKYAYQGESSKTEMFFDFLKTRLCDNNLDFYEYNLNWYAWVLQNPGKKIKVMIIYKGLEGSGKTMFADFFGNVIVGQDYYYSTSKMDDFVGRFNGLNENMLFVVFNEIKRSDTSDKTELLKEFLDTRELSIEKKGIEKRKVPSRVNAITTTNKDIPFVLDINDRRYTGISSLSPRMTPDDAKFAATQLFNIDNPDPILVADVYHRLMNRDISSFDPIESRVRTSFYDSCITSSVTPVEQFLYYFLYEKNNNQYAPRFENLLPETLYEEYKAWKQDFGGSVSSERVIGLHSLKSILTTIYEEKKYLLKVRCRKDPLDGSPIDRIGYTFDIPRMHKYFVSVGLREEILESVLHRSPIVQEHGVSSTVVKDDHVHENVFVQENYIGNETLFDVL